MASKKLIVFGEIDAGGIPHAYNKRSVMDWALHHPDKRIEITYNVIKSNNRTGQQNRYYRGVIVPNLQVGFKNIGYGMNQDRVHKTMRERSSVLVEFIDIFNETIPIITSTEDFDTDDWIEYIDECIRYGAEKLQVVIPDPIHERHNFNKKT